MPLLENLLQSEHREAILVPCKAAKLEWPTVRAILNSRSVSRTMSDLDANPHGPIFSNYRRAAPKESLRFWQVRRATTRDASPPGSAPAAQSTAIELSNRMGR